MERPQRDSGAERLLLDLLYSQANKAVLLHLLVAGVALQLLHDRVPVVRLWTWIGVLTLIILIRLGMIARLRGSGSVRALRLGYLAGAAATGAIWGLGMPLLALHAGPMTQAFFLLLITGISTGAVSLLALNRQIYLAFHLSLYAPVIATLAWLGTPDHLLLAGAALGLFLFQPLVAYWTHRNLAGSVELQQENRWLADTLMAANRELGEANRKLRTLATRDGLTQLFNRRRFDDALAEEVPRARRQGQWISLVMLDLDFFKAYNDHHGHLAGDDCLRRVARVLETAVRRPGDLAARFGGEEFVVLLPNTAAADAYDIAEEIRHRVLELGIVHGHSGAAAVVSVSAGVAGLRPRSEEDAQRLVERADRALYRAKSAGRNRSQTFQDDTL